MFVQFRNTTANTEAAANLGAGSVWEIPILDGYSFSQSTNTSEITLAEMESSAGVSRRGTRMFTDSLAPAEWSFSTYIRPFVSKHSSATGQAADSAAEVHAVEESLWASMFGSDTYSSYAWTRATNAVSGAVATPASASMPIVIAESNRSSLQSFVIYFLIDTATSNPLIYRLPESVVNEASIDFDVDGIAMINWSGFSKEVQDISGKAHIQSGLPAYDATNKGGDTILKGDISIDTNQSRSFNIVSAVPGSGSATVTRAIDEATTSTLNFIRNRLTAVEIEAAEPSDKVSGTFPGSIATVTAIDLSNDVITFGSAHNLSTGDQVYLSGFNAATTAGGDAINGQHLFVRVGDETGTYAGTTNATTEITLFGTKTQAENLGNATGKVGLAASSAAGGTVANGKYSLTLTGGNFTVGNNITYLVPEELGAINKPIEHVTGSRTSTGSATCYLTLEDADSTSGTSRQFFNDLVGTGAMAKVVNKFKVTMHIGGSAATGNTTDPALKIEFPTAHIAVPTHSIEDVISLEMEFTALPTDFGTADEITAITYYPVDVY
tara:strand:- start:4578 stop:6233 length:1656 start_codon:yes stop_codon:yes gene_type:complete